MLKKIFAENVLECVPDSNSFCLSELEAKKQYSILIKNVPENTFLIKCDKYPQTNNFFAKGRGLAKMADYAIISEEKKLIIIIELKQSSRAANAKDVAIQLKGAYCLFQYISLLAKSVLNENDIFKDYSYKYYRLIPISVSRKNNFSNQNQMSSDSPENFRTLNKNQIFFKELVSRGR